MPRPLFYKQQLNRKGGACAKDCGVIMMPNSYGAASITMTNSSLTKRIDRIEVRNYRSLGDVNLDLSDLTVLVGPNGSGKSNVLDVLRFVSDALRLGLDNALIAHERGGIGALRRHSPKGGRLPTISIMLKATIHEQDSLYHIEIVSGKNNEYSVKTEHCVSGEYYYELRDNDLIRVNMPYGFSRSDKILTLPIFGETPEFAPLYKLLTSQAGYYSIFPDSLRAPQQSRNPYPLDSHGENLANVLRQMQIMQHQDLDREFTLLGGSLARIVQGIVNKEPLSVQQVGSYLVTSIRHQDGSKFDLASESDGTVRVLGLLTAIYQTPRLKLIAIEEPELMIHPGALGVLCDIFKEASLSSQIILTTHSPDMISRFDPESLRLVTRENGLTQIALVSEVNVKAINDQLFTAGDLLRIGAFERG